MSLLERMGLVRTEYDGVPDVPVQSVPAEYEADLAGNRCNASVL